MEGSRITFTKLNGNNYHTWKYRMELFLTKEGLWEVILNKAASGDKELKKKDDEARAWLGLLVDDSQLNFIRKATSAYEAWNNLKDYYEKATISNKVNLMRKICNLKLEEGGDMELHIEEMTTYFDKLHELGEEKLSSEWTIAMILSSLPKSYDTLITALEMRPEGDLTISLVKSKLIEEYRRKSAANEDFSSYQDTAMKSSSYRNLSVECYFCKRKGHLKRNCKKYKDWKIQEERAKKTESEFCFMMSNMSKSKWIVDSGATSHMSNDLSNFISCNKNIQPLVTLANGQHEKAAGVGTCQIPILNNKNDIINVKVENVLYVPNLDSNLLSVKRLVSKGFRIIFQGTVCKIEQGKDVIATAVLIDNLYVLKQNKENVLQTAVHRNNCYHQWHRIFGHRNYEDIKLMQNRIDEGSLIKDCKIEKQCEVCIKGKMSKLTFPKKSENRAKGILDLIHTDVCGPMETLTPGHKRYFLTFIDDYSKYTVVYLLKEKSEVCSRMFEYVQFVKTKFLKTPKVIRSDRGGEYTCKRVQDFLKKEGIAFQCTAGYSPQQNGTAERKNRSLVEMTRCMLIDAKLDKKYWGEAIITACYLQNLLPQKGLLLTPYELWERRKPKINFLHIFGSQVLMYIPKNKRQKLDQKAVKLTFVGYDSNSKAYRLLDTKTNRVTVSRDVKFLHENISWNYTKENENNFNEEYINVKKYKQEPEFKEAETSGRNSEDEEIIHEIEESLQEEEEIEMHTDEEILDDNEEVLRESYKEVVQEKDNAEKVKQMRRSERTTKGKPPTRLMYEAKIVEVFEKEPKNIGEALKCKAKQEWHKAMNEEIKSLKDNDTWDLVKIPEGRKIVGCKWIYKIKRDDKGNIVRYKARLVAQGYSQKFGEDYDHVFAPVVKQSTVRALLSIAGNRKLLVRQYDIKTAFLNGFLDTSIFMKQPPGFEEGQSELVCKLKKGLYGLKQSARCWNQEIHQVLAHNNFIQNSADPCLYSKHSGGGEYCYLVVYVDDILICCTNQEEITKVECLLSKNFEIKSLGEPKYFLGINIFQDTNKNFLINQELYIKKVLEDFNMSNCKVSSYPVNPDYGKTKEMPTPLVNNKQYQKLIGCLLYISVNTRPDITACVSILARKVSSPTNEDWNELKRILKYLKGTIHFKLRLSKDGGTLNLIGYADANWASERTDRKSSTGYVFMLNGGTIS